MTDSGLKGQLQSENAGEVQALVIPCVRCGGPTRQLACAECRSCDACSPRERGCVSCYEFSDLPECVHYECAPAGVRRPWPDV